MTNPINLVLFSQYNAFNKAFESARDKNQEDRSKIAQQLLGLKEEMDINACTATAFPEKIKSSEQFSKMLAAKISCLFDKDVKGKPPSGPSKPTPSPSTQYVGFRNGGANCWILALFQILLHTPEGAEIVRTVGEYYVSGKDLDTARVPIFTKYCCQKDTPIFTEEAVKLFCAISSGYQRLRALEILCRSNAAPKLIEDLAKFLPQLEQEQLAKLKSSGDTHTVLNLLLANNEKAETNRLKESEKHGQYILDALVAYNQALLNAEIYKTIPKPVPGSISQNVRLAFHYFFGIQGKTEGETIFSTSPDAHEDANDALRELCGRCADIQKEKGTFPPKTYSQTETRTRYEPVGQPRPLTRPRTQLEPGNISRKSTVGYEISVDAGRKSGVSVEDLLDNHFQRPPILSPENYPVFLSEDGEQEQSYRPVEQHREFTGGAPRTFTLVIKRAALSDDGQSIKLYTRVVANQVITLPACAFPTDKREKAYALESFFVHRGGSNFGHYIAYRKIGDQWIEFDNEIVRRVSDAEIDRILQGRVAANFTPYALNYRIVPEDNQKEMLALSKKLRRISAPPQQVPLTSHEILMGLLSDLLILLKKPSCSEKEITQAFAAIEKTSPRCIEQLATFLEIQEGVKASEPRDFLCKNAKKLITPTASWIRTASGTILEQYIQGQLEKIQILACRKEMAGTELEQNLTKQYRTANLRAFLALLKNESISDAQLRAIFGQSDLPETIKNQIYTQIGEVMDASKADALDIGQKHFRENPRLLILPINKNPSTNIIEKIIATL